MATPRIFQPAPPGTISLVFRFSLFGIPVEIVINARLRTGVAPSAAELTAVAEAGDAWMTSQMLPVLSKDLLYTTLTATDQATATGRQIVIFHGPSVPGGVNAASLPSQNAAVVSTTTALRGKSYRGRTYLPGIPGTYLDPDVGDLLTASDAAMAASYQALWGSRLPDAGADQVVLSRTVGGVKRPIAVATVVTGSQSTTAVETMRRRSFSSHSRV